jgi:hypothetical protein
MSLRIWGQKDESQGGQAVKTSTETLIAAMRIFSRDIISDDGVTNAFIAEAAERLAEQHMRIKRLEEVGDAHMEWVPVSFQSAWHKAKEAKP